MCAEIKSGNLRANYAVQFNTSNGEATGKFALIDLLGTLNFWQLAVFYSLMYSTR